MSESRTTTIWVKSGNTRIGKVIVNQKGSEEEAPYFYVGSSFEDAYETSATTYNYPAIESNDTSLKYVYYVTNMEGYFLDVVSGSDTINSAYIDEQKHIVFVANVNQGAERYATLVIKSENNDTLATINITQKGKSEYYFYWGNTGTATSTATTAESEETTTTAIPYRTTYTNLTYNIVDGWITSVTLNNNTFVAGFSTNQGESDRTGTVQIKSGNDVVGTITITQKKPSVVYSIEVYPYNGSAGSTAQTSTTVTVTSVNQGWEYRNEGTNITAQPSMGNEGSTEVTLTFPAYNGTRTISFVGDEEGDAVFTFTQSDSPTPPTHTFYVTPTTGTLKTGETETITFSAYYDGLNVSSSSVWTVDNSISNYVSVTNGVVTLTASPATTLYDKRITASYNGKEDYGLLTIEAETVPDSLEVRLDNDTIAYTGTTNAKAFLTEHGETTEITNRSSLEFTSENEGVATVNNSSYGTKGLVTGHAPGTTNIYATYYSLTSNSVQLTVTGSPIDPDDPANWIWSEFRILLNGVRGGSETIQQTGRPEVNVEIMVSGMSEPYDITSKCGFIYKDDGSSSYGSSSNVGAVTLDGGNYKFVPSNTGETRIKGTYSYNGTHETEDYITVTVQSEPVSHDYYLILSATSETSTLQTGVTETISFAALIRDNYDPSWSGNDVTNDCTWSITNGGAYAKTGTTKGDVQLKSNPTTQQTGTVKAAYSYYSSATADFTILPPAAPTDELTGITVTIESAPDIPAYGGTVYCADVTYKVMAHYSSSPDKDVTNNATIIDCSAVTAESRGTITGNTQDVANLEMKVSYTEGGVTQEGYDIEMIQQEANILETGTTEPEVKPGSTVRSAWTVQSEDYDISIVPNTSESNPYNVGSGANHVSILVTGEKRITDTEYSGETWINISYPYSSYTALDQPIYGDGIETTGSNGENYITATTQPAVSAAVETYAHGGAVEHVRDAPMIKPTDYNYIVSWLENPYDYERIGWASFRVQNSPYTTGEFVISQNPKGDVPPGPTTRSVTITFEPGFFENDSNHGNVEFTIDSMDFALTYDDESEELYSKTFNTTVQPGAVGIYYPSFGENITKTFDISTETTSMNFSVEFTHIQGTGDDGSVSGNDYTKGFSITIGSSTSYEVDMPTIVWKNQ